MKPCRAEPFADYARDVLQSLVDASTYVFDDALPADRWGRRVVHALASGAAGPCLQERLVSAGAARVRPQSTEKELIAALLTAETAARTEHRGLWRAKIYSVRDAAAAEDAVGYFNLVEGVVRETYAGRGRFYLNFGEDFRKDFTVTAASRPARAWAKEGLVLEALAGAHVRARGHVAWINGPSIELDHPQAIEVLEKPELFAAEAQPDAPAPQ